MKSPLKRGEIKENSPLERKEIKLSPLQGSGEIKENSPS
jgi:hypothetical protein